MKGKSWMIGVAVVVLLRLSGIDISRHPIRRAGDNVPAHSAYSAQDLAPQSITATVEGWRTKCGGSGYCPVPASLSRDALDASTGDANGELNLARDLLDAADGAPHDEKVGAMWLARAAEGGLAAAQVEIARRRKGGLLVDTDDYKIAEALQAQVDTGHPDAVPALAPMYFTGRGVSLDPARGLALLTNAATAGDAASAKSLIDIYAEGAPGIPSNWDEMLRWVTFLAAKGDVDMMVRCGREMIHPGSDTPMMRSKRMLGLKVWALPVERARDIPEGYRWLMRAAMMNNGAAQEDLGEIFEEGLSIDAREAIARDPVAADMWYRLAVNRGQSAFGRLHLENGMGLSQIDEARKRAEAFSPIGFSEAMAMRIDLPGAGGKE